MLANRLQSLFVTAAGSDEKNGVECVGKACQHAAVIVWSEM